MLNNRVFQFIIVGVICLLAGYFYKDTKIITKIETKTEYVKVKGKTVVIAKPDGSSVSTTDFVSDSTSNTDASTKTIINPRAMFVTLDAGFTIRDKERLVGASFVYVPSWWVIGGGFLHNTGSKDNAILFKVGLAL